MKLKNARPGAGDQNASPASPAKGFHMQINDAAAYDTLTYEQRIRPLWATFRNILLVVFVIFVCAIVQMLLLWHVCNTGMKTAASMENQGLPTLNGLALLRQDLAIYRLNAYEYLFAQEGEKAGKAKAVQDIAAKTHAELEKIKSLLPEDEGRRLASNLENAFADLDTEFRKVQSLEDADFAGAMKAMDREIPPLTGRVTAAANAFSDYGYRFSGGQANATFDSFGWIKKNAILFGTANIAVAFGAVVFVLLAARRSRAQLSQTMARLDERTGELAYERDLLASLLDSSPDPIYFKDAQSNFLKGGKVQAELFGLKNADEMKGKSDFDFYAEAHARAAFEDEQEIIRTGQALIGKVEREITKNGRESWALTSKMPLRNKSGQIIGTFGISKDITPIKEAEEKLAHVHRQLVDASHQAGMAEIATSVLHNVGNVLNSVNVSCSLIADKARNSKVANLNKAMMMMRDHATDLGDYLSNDPKGKRLPDYLASLAEHLDEEQQGILREIASLMNNIIHIKEIVAMQQNYAKASGVLESLKVKDLVEDALSMNTGAMARHEVKVVREFTEVPPILTEKHKVLQVLVNLIRNAKYACDDSGHEAKQITLRIANGDGLIKISVIDNGIGIPPENLTRIFNHGFTTRKDGHGFGLHSGALAAKELGGTLRASSEGMGCGAVFTLELPVTQPKSS
jgi:PAS domain S-box-containing protein